MTRMRITALVLGAVLLAAKLGIDQSASPVAGPLEGTWQIVSVQREGQNETTHVGSRLVFLGNEVKLQAPLLLWNDEALRQPDLSIASSISSSPLIYWPPYTALSSTQYVNYDTAEQQKQIERAARS